MSIVPVDGTHQWSVNGAHAKRCSGNTWAIWQDNEWLWIGDEFSGEMIERHKQWSGPQDGLPPVGTVCEYWNDEWERCAVVAHLNSRVAFTCPDDEDDERVYIERRPNQHEFRPIKTPQQLAAEQRETAIREIMDIADVDCRVTAAKLVDAGFKREVV
jgi:hypothetical protein